MSERQLLMIVIIAGIAIAVAQVAGLFARGGVARGLVVRCTMRRLNSQART